MRRWLGRALVVGLVVGAIAVVFRQGLIPARFTPLPRLNIEAPLPLLVDWQIAELRYDRRLCRQTIANTKLISARQIGDRPIKDGCGWKNAVRMSRAGGASVRVTRVSCQVAAAFAMWVHHDVQPLAQKLLGERVASIQNYGTYSCRNIVGSQFWSHFRSQHATANAIDIAQFRLANGDTVNVLKDWRGTGKKAAFLRAVHRAACAYFRVALGPEFNRAHRNHFHFDRGPLWTCH